MNRTTLAFLSGAASLLAHSAAVPVSAQQGAAPQRQASRSSTSTRVGRKMTASGTIIFRRARRCFRMTFI